MKFKLVFLSGLLACAAGSFAPAARADVNFQKLSFAEAKKLAAKQHKDVMIDFYTTWCGWCKVLDTKTYTDEAVTKTADAKFVCVKIDAEQGEGKDLARQYKITGYPTIVFFTSTGKEITRVVGFEDAGKFLRSMKNAAAGGTASVLEEINNNATKPVKDPAKWLIAADSYEKNSDSKKALDAFRHVIDLDPENKKNCKEEAVYGQAFLTEGEAQWMLLEQATDQYPKNAMGSQAVMMLMKHNFDLNRGEQSSRIIDKWAMKNPDDGQTFNAFAWSAAEKGVELDKAEFYANRAMALAKGEQERAEIMDTQAEVFFKSGRLNEASMTEEQALHFIDSTKDKKLYKELLAQKAKFDKAQVVPENGMTVPVEQGNTPQDAAAIRPTDNSAPSH